MIDFFSRTGLFIVAIKVHRMSVAQAEEFYRPVRDTLRTKLKDVVAARAKAAIEREFGFNVPPEQAAQMGEILCPLFAANQFDNIVRFMSGRASSDCPPEQRDLPGTEKCIALVYEGVEAVRKIRDVLGPTDPSAAPPGSIRREFGQTILVNAAHASDSEENAKREMEIIKIRENNFKTIVEEFYGNL
jgi:nucleoside diphosphate kinase